MADNSFKITAGVATKMAELYRASKRTDATSGTPDRGRSRPDQQWFWAKIVTAGPHGESDYGDARYWVQRVFLSNSGGGNNDAIAVTVATGDYAMTVTATNTPDMQAPVRSLRAGDVVRVWWDYDFSSPTPKPRYVICQVDPKGVVVKFTGQAGTGGMYDGLILAGAASDPGAGNVVMPEGMDETANPTPCLIFHLMEINVSGWRAALTSPARPTAMAGYGVGLWVGMTTETQPRPIVMVGGPSGDDSHPKTILRAGAYPSPDPTTWDWSVDAQGGLMSVFSGWGVDTTANKIWLNTTQVRWDALGAMRFVHAEVQTTIDVEWVTVVTSPFTDTGSAITYDTEDVLVLAKRNPTTGNVLLNYGACS